MEDTYQIEGELAFISYMPPKLKVGMHFLTRVTVGLIEPEFLFFSLEHVPDDEEMFISIHGAPVRLFIVSTDGEETVIASSREVGWFNDEKEEPLRPITDKEINEIINNYDGYLDVECNEEGETVLYQNKVIISYLTEEQEDGSEDS